MYLEVKTENGFPWVRLKARNGKIVLTSEGYANLSKARRAAHMLSVQLGLRVRDRTKGKR